MRPVIVHHNAPPSAQRRKGRVMLVSVLSKLSLRGSKMPTLPFFIFTYTLVKSTANQMFTVGHQGIQHRKFDSESLHVNKDTMD